MMEDKFQKGQMMWLGAGNESNESEIEITATDPLRLVLYAGEPLRKIPTLIFLYYYRKYLCEI